MHPNVDGHIHDFGLLLVCSAFYLSDGSCESSASEPNRDDLKDLRLLDDSDNLGHHHVDSSYDRCVDGDGTHDRSDESLDDSDDRGNDFCKDHSDGYGDHHGNVYDEEHHDGFIGIHDFLYFKPFCQNLSRRNLGKLIQTQRNIPLFGNFTKSFFNATSIVLVYGLFVRLHDSTIRNHTRAHFTSAITPACPFTSINVGCKRSYHQIYCHIFLSVARLAQKYRLQHWPARGTCMDLHSSPCCLSSIRPVTVELSVRQWYP